MSPPVDEHGEFVLYRLSGLPAGFVQRFYDRECTMIMLNQNLLAVTDTLQRGVKILGNSASDM